MMDYWIYTLFSLSMTMKTGFSMEINKIFKLGEEIKLSCVVDNNYPRLWIYLPNANASRTSSKTLAENKHVHEKYHNINIVGNTSSDYHLIISNLTEKNVGHYKCFQSGNLRAEFNLEMKVAPSEIQILNKNGIDIAVGYENEDLHIVCYATGGIPEGKLYWKETDITFTRTSCIWPWANLTFVPLVKHDGKILTCAVTHEMLDVEKEVSVKLSVQYKPKIDIFTHPKGVIIEDDKIELKCQDQSSPPKTNITWKKDGQVLSFESEYIIAKSRINDSGIYTCTAVNIVGQVEKDILILVNKSTTSNITNFLGLQSFLCFGILTLSFLVLLASAICNICTRLHCKKLSRVSFLTVNNDVSRENIEMTDINNGYHTINDDDIRQEDHEVENSAEIQSIPDSSSDKSDDQSTESTADGNKLGESDDYLNPYCTKIQNTVEVHNYETLDVGNNGMDITALNDNNELQRSYENLKF